MNYVRAGAIDGEREVKQGGFVVHNEPDGIWASWLATDHQSGIDTYMVAMGTSPGELSIIAFLYMRLRNRKFG